MCKSLRENQHYILVYMNLKFQILNFISMGFNGYSMLDKEGEVMMSQPTTRCEYYVRQLRGHLAPSSSGFQTCCGQCFDFVLKTPQLPKSFIYIPPPKRVFLLSQGANYVLTIICIGISLSRVKPYYYVKSITAVKIVGSRTSL